MHKMVGGVRVEMTPAEISAWNTEWSGFVPPARTLTRLPKADLWRRATDVEASALNAALAAAPLRLQRIFEAAQYLDTTDADYPALRTGVVAALGEARAVEVLSPTE
jgi:hypothetical protein